MPLGEEKITIVAMRRYKVGADTKTDLKVLLVCSLNFDRLDDEVANHSRLLIVDKRPVFYSSAILTT